MFFEKILPWSRRMPGELHWDPMPQGVQVIILPSCQRGGENQTRREPRCGVVSPLLSPCTFLSFEQRMPVGNTSVNSGFKSHPPIIAFVAEWVRLPATVCRCSRGANFVTNAGGNTLSWVRFPSAPLFGAVAQSGRACVSPILVATNRPPPNAGGTTSVKCTSHRFLVGEPPPSVL